MLLFVRPDVMSSDPQVNCVRTRDLDCGLAVPLLTEAGDSLDLVVSRTAGAASDGGGGR